MISNQNEGPSNGVDPLGRLETLLSANDPLNWVIAGDSIAQGARWTKGERDYAQLLEERVRFELGRGKDVFCRTAVSGWRIEDVFDSLERLDPLHLDIVSIGVGVNDASLGPGHHAEFCQAYEETLTRLRASDALMIVHTPNTVRADADPVLRECLGNFAESIGEIGRRAGALVVDHFAAWSAGGRLPDDEWMADDIHPNALGHRKLARSLFEFSGLWDDRSETCRLIADSSPAEK